MHTGQDLDRLFNSVDNNVTKSGYGELTSRSIVSQTPGTRMGREYPSSVNYALEGSIRSPKVIFGNPSVD